MSHSVSRLLNGEQRLRLAGHPLASARRAARGLAGLTFDYQGLRRRVLRTLVFHAVAPATPVVAVERDGLRFLVETADLGPGRIMYTRGSLEQDVLETAVRAAGLSPENVADRCFVDVGANVGAASVLALGRLGFRSALAVEPNSANVALLRANLAINGLEGRCRTVVAAAGAEEGSVELELSPDNFGDHRIRSAEAGPGEFREESRDTRRVPLRTLDSILVDEGVAAEDVGLLWVDVQGYEAGVLAGAAGVLEREIPVVLEFWPYGLRRAGGLDVLFGLLERHFASFADLRTASAEGDVVRHPIGRLRDLEAEFPGGPDATDLLLMP